MSGRLVAVLGYSVRGETLHEICASRLRRAAAEARPDDVILLSGWARRRTPRSEAELMADAWEGEGTVVVSADARSTLGNARGAAELASRLGSSDVVLVTSAWHQRRAASLFRAALRGTGARLALAPADGAGSVRLQLRELACWTLVPLQIMLAVRERSNLRH